MFVAWLLVLAAAFGFGISGADESSVLLLDEPGRRAYKLPDGSVWLFEWPRLMVQSDTFIVAFRNGSSARVTASSRAYAGVEMSERDPYFVVRQPREIVTRYRVTPRSWEESRLETLDLMSVPDEELGAWPLKRIRRIIRIDPKGKHPFPIRRPMQPVYPS